MNRRMGAVLAVVVVLAGGLVLLMFVQQRALMAQARAEQAHAQAERQRAEEALVEGTRQMPKQGNHGGSTGCCRLRVAMRR